MRLADLNHIPLISIHPPRTGRDALESFFINEPINFNPPSPHGEGPWGFPWHGRFSAISIHPPRTGRDLPPSVLTGSPCLFQSTLPARGGTSCQGYTNSAGRDFNPPSPHGEGPLASAHKSPFPLEISIHPPRTGRDRRRPTSWTPWRTYFNPPSPHGEGLLARNIPDSYRKISIHPPRTGRDYISAWWLNSKLISIHPPRTGRDGTPWLHRIGPCRFQSTLPARGGTRPRGLPTGPGNRKFQSTLPARGGTHQDTGRAARGPHISIHPPRTGRDRSIASNTWPSCGFQSTLPARGGTGRT